MEALQVSEDVETERQAIFEKLRRESPIFKAINDRVKRSEGLDAALNNMKASAVRYIDRLLDRYNVLEFESIPVLAVPEPEPYPDTTTAEPGGWEHELDGRGLE